MTISKKNLYKWIYALIFLPLAVRFFTDNFGMPYTIMPMFDILALVILFLSDYLTRKISKKAHILEFWLFIFIGASVISIIAIVGQPYKIFFIAEEYLKKRKF